MPTTRAGAPSRSTHNKPCAGMWAQANGMPGSGTIDSSLALLSVTNGLMTASV